MRKVRGVPFCIRFWPSVGDASEVNGTTGSMISKTYTSMRSGDFNAPVMEYVHEAQAPSTSAEIPSGFARSKRSRRNDGEAFEGQV